MNLFGLLIGDRGQQRVRRVAAAAADQRRDIGYAALDYGAYSAALFLLDHGDTAIDVRALWRIALWAEAADDFDQVRRWYNKVIATGHPDCAPAAMRNLGVVEETRGDLEEARYWYREAIATGHAEAAGLAESALRDLDRRQEEKRRAAWYAKYGYQAYADLSMMRRPMASSPTSDPPRTPNGDSQAENSVKGKGQEPQ